MSRTRHNNVGVSANIVYNPHDIIPMDRAGNRIEVAFPIAEIKSIEQTNNPLTRVDDYVSNQKSMAAEMLRRRNLNEKLNFANTFFPESRSVEANKEAMTIFGFTDVFTKQTIDANARASVKTNEHLRDLESKQTRVQEFLRKTEEIVEERKIREFQSQTEGIDAQRTKLKEIFLHMKKAVRSIITGENDETEKFAELVEEDIVPRGDLEKIRATPKKRDVVLETTSNIRQFLGYKSGENQGKLHAAYEERDKKIAEVAAKKADEEKKEREKIEFYSDLKGLQQRWKIFDQDKLKETIRNEVMKEFMREGEKRSYKAMAKMSRSKTPERTRKTPEQTQKTPEPTRKPVNNDFVNKEKANLVAKSQERAPLEQVAKIPRTKIEKKASETTEEFNNRREFYSLSNKKAPQNIFKQHKASKNFVEMAVTKSLKTNGKIGAILVKE